MTNTLTSRWPKFDFDHEKIVWSDNPECAMVWNGMSLSAPVVEPWLNKVMMVCRKRLLPKDQWLREEIDEFVRQESNHYRMHNEFNKAIARAGYAAPPDADETLKNELREQLNDKSLAFNAAYCAGFENFTLFSSQFMFEEAGDLFQEGDLGGSDMWLWHMAEEYEHRSVCHNVYAAISGNYFLRIYALFYSFIHLNRHVSVRVKALMEQYRDKMQMTPEQRAESIKREKAYNRRYALYAFPRMLKILVPFYNPGRAKAAPKLTKALMRYSAMSVSTKAA